MNSQSKITIFTKNNHKPTPMPSSLQDNTPKFSYNTSSLMSDSIPLTIIQQTGILFLILNLKCCYH